MLSLYYRPEVSDETDLLAAAIWIDVFGDTPREALEQACCEWERNEERRPTPAGIRKRALARVSEPAPVCVGNAIFAPVIVDAGELERRRGDKFQDEMRRIFPKLKQMTKCEGE